MELVCFSCLFSNSSLSLMHRHLVLIFYVSVLNQAAANPAMMADLMKSLQDPEIMAEAQKMMSDPAFQSQMKAMMGDKTVEKVTQSLDT